MWFATEARRAVERADAVKTLFERMFVARQTGDTSTWMHKLLPVAEWYIEARLLPTFLEHAPLLLKKRKANTRWYWDLIAQCSSTFLDGFREPGSMQALQSDWEGGERRVAALLAMERLRLEKNIEMLPWLQKDSPLVDAFLRAIGKTDEPLLTYGCKAVLDHALLNGSELGQHLRLIKDDHNGNTPWDFELVICMRESILNSVSTSCGLQDTCTPRRFLRHAIARGYLLGAEMVRSKAQNMVAALMERRRAVRRLVKSAMRNVVKEWATPSPWTAVCDASDNALSPDDVLREQTRRERAVKERQQRQQRLEGETTPSRDVLCFGPRTPQPRTAPFMPTTEHRRAGEKAQSIEAARAHAEELREKERARISALEAGMELVNKGREIGGGT